MPNMKSYHVPTKVSTETFQFTMFLRNPNKLSLYNIVGEMKRLIKDMLEEVENVDKSSSVCEEIYGKLEQKVRKKFNDEVERLEKSFRRIIEQLEI